MSLFDGIFGKNNENKNAPENGENFNLSYLSAHIEKAKAEPKPTEDDEEAREHKACHEALKQSGYAPEDKARIDRLLDEAREACSDKETSAEEAAKKTFGLGKEMILADMNLAGNKLTAKQRQAFTDVVTKNYDLLAKNYDIFGTPVGMMLAKTVMEHEQHMQMAAHALFSLLKKDALPDKLAEPMVEMFIAKVDKNVQDLEKAIKVSREMDKKFREAAENGDLDDFGPSDDLRRLMGDNSEENEDED